MFEELQKLVIEGNEEDCMQLTKKYLDEGSNPANIIKEGLLLGMCEVGKRFKAYEMYLPEVIMSANAMKKSTDIVKPLIAETDLPSMGKVIIATIQGDLHDIGKNLVSMMLEGAGFEIIDLGVDVPVDKILDAINKDDVELVGISALLTTTMMGLESAVKKIHENNSDVNVMVGGAPLTQDFADKIGADGFAPDALRAIELSKKLLGLTAGALKGA